MTIRYCGEAYRAKIQVFADKAHAAGDTKNERFFAGLIWQSAKKERDQPRSE